jgi:hypothetical protein
MDIEIGERLPVVTKIGTAPIQSREYQVSHMPESLRVRVYCNDQGWYFSAQSTSDRRVPLKEPKVKLPNAGEIVSSRDEVLDRLRSYLRACVLD